MDDFLPIQQQVERLLRKKHRLRYPLIPELHLIDDLGLDSLTRVELVIDLEEHFLIAIPDERFDTLRTVQDVVRCVSGLLPPGAKVAGGCPTQAGAGPLIPA